MSEKPLILVVDDDAPILILMKSLLREFGFEAALAATGQQALEEFRRQRPSLILLDKNMPGMSGGEILSSLRDDGLDGIPVLILSGEPMPPDELAQLGVDGAILKPFDVMRLVETIRRYVGS
jgi:CheY-like chemotaxis protein